MWERISKKIGRPHKEIEDKPKCPPEMLYLWGYYAAVKSSCEAVGPVELDAWCRLMKLEISIIEARIILNLDVIRKAENVN